MKRATCRKKKILGLFENRVGGFVRTAYVNCRLLHERCRLSADSSSASFSVELNEQEGWDDWDKDKTCRVVKVLLSRRNYGENADLHRLLDCGIVNSGLDN